MRKIIFKDEEWPSKTATLIFQSIKKSLVLKNSCSIFLTGGIGASRLYPYLSMQLKDCHGEICFYLGDERCVSSNDSESNYGMILKTLFHNGLKNNWKFFKMYEINEDPSISALRYHKIIPDKIDILLLGLGDDGHIASLFPNQIFGIENNRKVITTFSTNNEQMRITITKSVIESADEIMVLASGIGKKNILSKILIENEDFSSIPAKIALRGLWLLDESAEGIH
jgi:6-phosphogluconolactonase